MIFKAKTMIKGFQNRFRYEQCFRDKYENSHRYIYPKVFGKCTGVYPGYKHPLDCKYCPYYVEIKAGGGNEIYKKTFLRT